MADIRVLVVDDHAVVRHGLRSFLDLQPGISVVGEAEDGAQALAVAGDVRPDVVLIDLVMPVMDGVAATRALKSDLVLEAVARAEGIQVTKEDLDDEIRALAQATGRDPKEVRRIVERTGQVVSLASDIIRSKALDVLVDRADVASQEAVPAMEAPDDEA